MDVTDLRRVQARLGGRPRGEQGAVSIAVTEALGPLAEMGGQFVAAGDVMRLLADARPAIESAGRGALRRLLAEAEAMPGTGRVVLVLPDRLGRWRLRAGRPVGVQVEDVLLALGRRPAA
jgi:hypothetical protein